MAELGLANSAVVAVSCDALWIAPDLHRPNILSLSLSLRSQRERTILLRFEPGSGTMLKGEKDLEEEMISLIDRLYNGGETLYRRGENIKMENTINQT